MCKNRLFMSQLRFKTDSEKHIDNIDNSVAALVDEIV
jgi:hypothetical protein